MSVSDYQSEIDEVLIVYVQLGKNPSPTLIKFANHAKLYFPTANLVLISDNSILWEDFPGEVIEYCREDISDKSRNFLSKFPEFSEIAGGYWLYTLERFFALEILHERYSKKLPILHFESDVLSFISREILQAMQKNCLQTSFPRFNETKGIGSVLFSPNLRQLVLDLDKLIDLLSSSNRWRNDMDVLGLALHAGIATELPTFPENAIPCHKSEIIFDGAAIGQYLFGVDPMHTEGKVISGFENINFKIDLNSGYWKVTSTLNDGLPRISWVNDKDEVILANLHIHSKLPLEPIDDSRDIWDKCIDEANHNSTRNTIHVDIPTIHNTSVSLRNKIRLLKRRIHEKLS